MSKGTCSRTSAGTEAPCGKGEMPDGRPGLRSKNEKEMAMDILVCIKQVPGSSNVEVDPVTGVLKRDGIQSKMNPYDLYAVEAALHLTEQYGGRVEVITMGPPQAKKVITEAICMGAAGGTVLSDRKFAGADVLATAYTLSQGIQKMGKFDLILCGKQTTDGDTAQVGAEIAEFLGLPNVANVLTVKDAAEGTLTVTAALDDKVAEMTVRLPCLLSMDGDINSPRLPSYRVMKSIPDDRVTLLSFDAFDDKNADNYGLSGSATQVERIFPPEKNAEKRVIDGTPREQAEGLYDLIRSNKLI